MIGDVGIYVLMLVKLVGLLRSVSFARFNASEILTKNLISETPATVSRYIGTKYVRCINHNNSIIEERYKRFNFCVKLMVSNVCFFYYFSTYLYVYFSERRHKVMSENIGLNDQDLLQLCRSGEAITNQDIGGIMPQLSNTDSRSNDLTYLSESGMQGINFVNFSRKGNNDDNEDR